MPIALPFINAQQWLLATRFALCTYHCAICVNKKAQHWSYPNVHLVAFDLMNNTSSINGTVKFLGRKLRDLERYYKLVQKGSSPEQTRRDLNLSVDEISQFDFSVFDKPGPLN